MKHYCCQFALNLQLRIKGQFYFLLNDVIFMPQQHYLVLGSLYSSQKYRLRNGNGDQQVSVNDVTIAAQPSVKDNNTQFLITLPFRSNFQNILSTLPVFICNHGKVKCLKTTS